jgi:hypothetical protein
MAEGSQQVTFEHFRAEYDIQCNGSITNTSKVIRFQQLIMLFDKLAGHPNIRQIPMLKMIFEMGEYNNIEEIIEENPEPPKEDVKTVYAIRGDMLPEQTAQVLEKDGIKTSPMDLMGANIEQADNVMAKHAKTQKAMMGVGGPEQNVPERMGPDLMAQGAKQNANRGG